MKLLRGRINFLSFITLAASVFVPDQVQAWHSMPHMIVGAVARLNLSESAQGKIEYILGLWRGQYPRQCTLERACVWLDDISRKDGVGTDVTRRFDFLRLFQYMHGTNKPWNPHNIKLKGLDAVLPIYERTAVFLLDTAYNGLMNTTPSMEKFEDAFCTVPPAAHLVSSEGPGASPLAATTFGQMSSTEGVSTGTEERSDNSKRSAPSSSIRRPPAVKPKTWPSSENPAGIGSILSLNLYLRMLLHLIADIHQPLHAVNAFYKAFPHGDTWGHNVTMRMPDGTETTLHQFWDSGGFLYTKRAREATDEEIREEAQQLMKEYPISRLLEHFKKTLLAPYFHNIADETFALATTFVYKELNLAKLKFSELPYTPTQAYIDEAQVISRRQLALAGYRLGHALEVIAKYLPHPDNHKTD